MKDLHLHPPYASLCTFVPIQLHDKSMNHAPRNRFFTALKKFYPLSLGQNPKMFLRFTGNFAEICCPPKCPSLRCIFEEASLVSESCIHSLWEWFSIKFATQLLQEKDHLPNLHIPCMLIHHFLQRKCLETVQSIAWEQTSELEGSIKTVSFLGAHTLHSWNSN